MSTKRDKSLQEAETSYRLRMSVSFHERLKAVSKKHKIPMQRLIMAILPDEVARLERAEA